MTQGKLRSVTIAGPGGVTVIPGDCNPNVTVHPSGACVVCWFEEDGAEHRAFSASVEMVYDPPQLVHGVSGTLDLRKS